MGSSQIFLFVPNLIGYARVILAILSFAIAFDQSHLFCVFYVISFLLDAADGYFARMLNQCSRFGAVLDMVTDRFATAALVMILSHLYPQWVFTFVLLNILDFVSHWFRMYSSLARGETSHKSVNEKQNVMLRIYYGNRKVMGILCLGNELFYWFLYINYWFDGTVSPILGFQISIWTLCVCICAPLFLIKQFLNLLQLINSAIEITEWEWEDSKKSEERPLRK